MALRPISARPTVGGPDTRATAAKAFVLLGAATACALTVGSALLAAPATAEPAPQTVDHRAVVLVNFRNLALADPQKAHDQALQNFFGAGDSLATYYAQNSGNRMSIVPAKGDGVFGPFTIDMDDSAACDTKKMNELARQAIPDVAFDHISVVFHSNFCADWWGLGSMPGPNTWFHEGAVADKAAVVHEAGHNLGLAHQERRVCTAGSFTTCTADGYSDRTPMGGGGEKKGLSAPELLSQKWLTTQQVTTPSATTTVHLTPLHAPGASGVRAVDLPLGAGGDRVVVEFRTADPATADRNIAQGVNVYRVPGGRYDKAVMISNVKHDDKTATGSFTTAGTEFADDSAQLSIKVAQATASGADVRVQLGPAASARPTEKPTTPGPTPTHAPSTATRPSDTAPPVPSPSNHQDQPDDHAVIGSTATVGGTPSTTPTGAGSLASTGGSGTGTGIGIGAALIAVGGSAVFVLRKRRTHRRH
ncbi:LPXTG cell wall anchor domain-containing protein [Kitasatospora sp. NPDC057015]|uniref:LPXTG cell wall anchor domain-containing protein n=1 Tax=Kitasatospora sp. NPDC057015 TaxID=3346001 RepID=UPI003641EF2D